MPKFRRCFLCLSAPLILPLSAPAVGQNETERSDGSVEIDILATVDDLYGPAPAMEDCSDEQEAAILSGEIIVCRRKQDQREYRTVREEEAETRYARETMNKDNPQTPNPCGPFCGIFTGEPTIGGLCIPGLQKCPPPPALIIDVRALPKAPPGSDADRIARGLPPIGDDTGDDDIEQEQLGLPSVDEVVGAASPAAAAEPMAEQ